MNSSTADLKTRTKQFALRVIRLPEGKLKDLYQEADQLTAILVTCVKNAKST